MSKTPCALTVCVQCGTPGDCRGRNGKLKANPVNQQLVLSLRNTLERQHPEAAKLLSVRLSRCQGACDAPCGWQLAGVGRESLQWEGGHADLVSAMATAAAQYALLAPHQRLTKAHYPGELRGKLRARLFPWPKPKGYR